MEQDDDVVAKIDALLDREILDWTRSELAEFRRSALRGELSGDDRRYVAALHARLIDGRAAEPVNVPASVVASIRIQPLHPELDARRKPQAPIERTWQDQRRRELWAADIGLLALLAGLWGTVFRVDAVVAVALAVKFGSLSLASYSARAIAYRVGMFGGLCAVGYAIPPELLHLSPLATVAAPVLAVGTVTHWMTHSGNNHRLMDCLVESGEFQRDHDELKARNGT